MLSTENDVGVQGRDGYQHHHHVLRDTSVRVVDVQGDGRTGFRFDTHCRTEYSTNNVHSPTGRLLIHCRFTKDRCHFHVFFFLNLEK
jgi:hypothetical protein